MMNINEKIFIAGSSGMVGSAIKKSLKEKGYGNTKLGGSLLTPKRTELDLLEFESVKNWFKLNKPKVVIVAAAKVGGIYVNNKYPYNFLSENTDLLLIYSTYY